jgi:hypothetical protein
MRGRLDNKMYHHNGYIFIFYPKKGFGKKKLIFSEKMMKRKYYY